jgi:hypothetical protein
MRHNPNPTKLKPVAKNNTVKLSGKQMTATVEPTATIRLKIFSTGRKINLSALTSERALSIGCNAVIQFTLPSMYFEIARHWYRQNAIHALAETRGSARRRGGAASARRIGYTLPRAQKNRQRQTKKRLPARQEPSPK